MQKRSNPEQQFIRRKRRIQILVLLFLVLAGPMMRLAAATPIPDDFCAVMQAKCTESQSSNVTNTCADILGALLATCAITAPGSGYQLVCNDQGGIPQTVSLEGGTQAQVCRKLL
jgi:hypothetical protein